MSGTPGATSNPAGARPKAIGSGRCGRVRAALRRAIAEARDGDRMTLEDEVTALLAERVAALVDDFAGAGRGADMLRAAKDLRELLDELPLRGEEVPAHGGTDARGRVLELFGGPPIVGDSAQS